MGIASVSVDLDTLPHYCRIHGLPESILSPEQRALIWTAAVPRLLARFSRFGIRATLFAIGEDLSDPDAASTLRAAASRHELASHTFAHAYDVSRWPEPRIAEDLAAAQRAIASLVGRAPVGLRAPGYTLSPALYAAAAVQGFRYGSSTFPSLPYYAAKATILAAMRLVGRRSRSVLDRPRVLFAPRRAYFPDPVEPYRRGQGPLLELPITVTPILRLPFIGTLITLWPKAAVATLYRGLRREPFLNLELHAVDALGSDDGLPEPLVKKQRDLGLPVEEKLSRLDAALARIAADFELLALEDAEKRLRSGVPNGPPKAV